jgi:hypothetical protein
VSHVVPIDEWPLGKDHKIVVSLIEYEGRWRFDARIYYRDETGVMHPGKGLPLRLDQLERFANATAKALRGARLRDLISAKADESEIA